MWHMKTTCGWQEKSSVSWELLPSCCWRWIYKTYFIFMHIVSFSVLHTSYCVPPNRSLISWEWEQSATLAKRHSEAPSTSSCTFRPDMNSTIKHTLLWNASIINNPLLSVLLLPGSATPAWWCCSACSGPVRCRARPWWWPCVWFWAGATSCSSPGVLKCSALTSSWYRRWETGAHGETWQQQLVQSCAVSVWTPCVSFPLRSYLETWPSLCGCPSSCSLVFPPVSIFWVTRTNKPLILTKFPR